MVVVFVGHRRVVAGVVMAVRLGGMLLLVLWATQPASEKPE
jgi:hypothetical protein